MKFTALAVAAAMLVGCAAPNTPGAGAGDRYTPLIDMQGLDTSRYSADLTACRSYAQTINPMGEAIAGAIIGGLIGAAVGSAVGSGTRWQGSMTRYGAGHGAGVGVVAGGVDGTQRQETVMANCMAGRGYRVLDRWVTVPVASNVPSPYAPVSQRQVAAPVAQVPQAAPIAFNPPPVEPSTTVRDVGGNSVPGCRWVTPIQWSCQ